MHVMCWKDVLHRYGTRLQRGMSRKNSAKMSIVRTCLDGAYRRDVTFEHTRRGPTLFPRVFPLKIGRGGNVVIYMEEQLLGRGHSLKCQPLWGGDG